MRHAMQHEIVLEEEKVMELKEFVSTTFKQIIEGIDDARSSGSAAAQGIASAGRFKFDKVAPGMMQDVSGGLFSVVDFDVALTVNEKVSGEGGLNVMAIKLGGSAGTENQSASRVKFSIPLKLNF